MINQTSIMMVMIAIAILMNVTFAETSLEFYERRAAEMKQKYGQATNVQVGNEPAGVKGLDISAVCHPDRFKCLKEKSYHFAIVRCFRSIGSVDTNCPHTIYNAWEGGMDHVDAYIFPCPHCAGSKNGTTQVIEMVNYIRSYKAKFGMIWLDIEGAQYWSKDTNFNRAFFTQLVQGARAARVHVGVYTQKWFWEQNFGGNWDVSAYQMPIWYAHYDHRLSYYDWSPFGGWKVPNAKQYAGDVSDCGCSFDANVY